MKAVLISIRPKWCELIASRKKTIEVRKSRPKLETPFKCYIYETMDEDYKGRAIQFHRDGRLCGFVHYLGKIIGEFVCDYLTNIQAGIDTMGMKHLYNTVFIQAGTCLTEHELFDYLHGGKKKTYGGWAWHISDLTIYDRPRELGELIGGSSRLTFSEDGKKIIWSGLKRPPQSWCYVEEVTDQ